MFFVQLVLIAFDAHLLNTLAFIDESLLDVLNGLLDNASVFGGAACHGEGFTTSRRPVHKYRAVLAFKHFVHKLLYRFINLLLGSVLIVDACEFVALCVLTGSYVYDLGLPFVNRVAEYLVLPVQQLAVVHLSYA